MEDCKAKDALILKNVKRNKKGYCLIITFIVASLCMILMFTIFKYNLSYLECRENKLKSRIKISKDDSREYLFTILSKDIKENCILNKDSLEAYLKNNYLKYKKGNLEIRYDEKNSMLILAKNYDYVIIQNFYKITFDENKVHFFYDHKEYINK